MFSKIFSHSKAFLLVALTMAICMVCTNTVQAQSNRAILLRTASGTTFNYGKQAIITTTDGSAHTAATVLVGNNEAGVIEVTVTGFDSTDGAAVTGCKIARYVKTAGTLTVGSATSSLAVAADTALGSATFAISGSSNNIIVSVTGNTGVTCKWIVNIRLLHNP